MDFLTGEIALVEPPDRSKASRSTKKKQPAAHRARRRIHPANRIPRCAHGGAPGSNTAPRAAADRPPSPGRDGLRQHGGRHDRIGVDEDQQPPARRARPGVARRRDLPHLHLDDKGAARARDRSGRVGRAVVDDDDLGVEPARRLAERVERCAEQGFFLVVRGNDQGDDGLRHVPPL